MRLHRRVIYQALAFVATVPAVSVPTAAVGSSGQVINRTIIYEERPTFIEPPAPAAEVVTVDKYFYQLDLPVRRKPVTAGAYQLEARSLFPIVPWGWYAQLDRTHPLKRVAVGQVALQFVAAAPGSATAQNWFQQLDTPTRRRKLHEFPATSIPVYFVPPTPGAGNELNWWPALNEPVRPRLSIRAAQQQGLTLAPRLLTTTLENAWHQRLGEPVRRKVTLVQYPGAQSYFLFTAPETITIDKWWRELVRPVRIRPQPHQQGYTFIAAAPGRGIAYNWFTALDTPTRRRKSFQSDAAYGNYTPPVVPVSFYASTSASALVWQRAVLFDNDAMPPTGLALPVVYQQTITINVTVEFGQMLRYSCMRETQDGFEEQTEASDAWSVQGETEDTSDEQTQLPSSGCCDED